MDDEGWYCTEHTQETRMHGKYVHQPKLMDHPYNQTGKYLIHILLPVMYIHMQ